MIGALLFLVILVLEQEIDAVEQALPVVVSLLHFFLLHILLIVTVSRPIILL